MTAVTEHSIDDFYVELPPHKPSAFDACTVNDRVRVTLASGEVITGQYQTIIGQHFVTVGVGMKAHVAGPYGADDITALTIVQTAADAAAERHERVRGALVPGRLYRTRDGYQARLELLANYIARAESFVRKREIRHQFDDVADEIELAQTKRTWMVAIARWNTHSNQEPTKIDLSGGCMTTAQGFQRPRPQDFDPDRKVRRARVPVPDHVRNDPRSTRNMVKALNAAGFKARASVIGEITDDAADVLVDFPGGKQNGRFSLTGRRQTDGQMAWGAHWDGNGTKADQTRHRRCLNRDAYQTFRRIVTTGLQVAPAALV